MRQQRLAVLKSAAALVAPLRSAMLASVRLHILHTIADYDPALIAVVIDAIKHPDLLFVRDLLHGFSCYGHLPTTGVFKLGGAPPKQPVQPTLNLASNTSWNSELLASVHNRGDQAALDQESEAWKAIVAVWAATAADVSEGWAEGKQVPPSEHIHAIPSLSQACHEVTGFTTREVDTHPWVKGKGQWRALRRFGILEEQVEAD